MEKEKKIEIDFLRGLLSICVCLGHIFDALTIKANFFGTSWVVGFVILSGYLIEGSLVSNLPKKNYTVKNYIILRITRIFPLYFFIIFISILFFIFNFNSTFFNETSSTLINRLMETYNLKNLIGQIFFLTGIIPGFKTFFFLNATPTLVYEFFYYLTWSLRFYFSKYYIYLIFILFLILYYFKVILFDFVIFYFIWLIGTLLHNFKKFFFNNFFCRLGYISLFFFTSLYLFDETNYILKKLTQFYFHEYFLFIIPFSLIILGKNSIFYQKFSISIFFVKFSKWLGNISYPLFIVHTFIILILEITVSYFDLNQFLNSYFLAFIYLFIIIFISQILSLLIEKPIMKFRERIKERNNFITIRPNYEK